LDRLVVVLNSMVGVPFSQVGQTAADQSQEVFCIELDRLVVIPDRTVVVALALVGVAALEVGGGVF
jgi:hypothetical protein